MSSRRFFRSFFLLTGAIVSFVTALNYAVNPLGVYGTPVVAGLNDRHPAAVNYTRILKPEEVKRLKPDVVIIGSSRAEIGMDPRPEIFPGVAAYNFGLPASTIREQRLTLEYAQAVHPLKLAINTLDFFSFNARRLENRQFDPDRMSRKSLSFWPSFCNTYGSLLSFDTLTASLKTLRYLRHIDRYAFPLPNGRKTNNDVAEKIREEGMAPIFAHPPNEQAIASEDFSFDYSVWPGDTVFRHFRAMLDFARAQGIDVIVLFSPVHVQGLEGMKDRGEMGLFLEWKKNIEAAMRAEAKAHDAKPYPLWDFAEANSLTTEKVPQKPGVMMRWFWDPGHYTAALGDVVLKKILGRGDDYPDFGKRRL